MAYTDVLYCDVKHLDTEMHKKLTGLGNERILENLKRAVETASCRIVLNFPMIPACNVDEKNCVAFAQMMQDLSLRDVRLLRFHCLGEHEYNELGIQYPAKEFPKLTDQMIADIQEIFVQRGIRIVTE